MRLQTRNTLSASATGLVLGAMFMLIPGSATAESADTPTPSAKVSQSPPLAGSGYTGVAESGDVDCWSDVTCERTARGLTPEPNEDEVGWNCLTMGNGHCGPGFVPVSQELGDALSEGEAADATTREWEACLILEGDTSYVACPDGLVVTS